jgi:hypothetical protein
MEQTIQQSRDISRLEGESERAQQSSLRLKEDRNALTTKLASLQGQHSQAKNALQSAKAQGDQQRCSALQLQMADIAADIEDCQQRMSVLRTQIDAACKNAASSAMKADIARDNLIDMRVEHEVQAQAVWADLKLARLHMSAADTEHAEILAREQAEAALAMQTVLTQHSDSARGVSLSLRRAGKGNEAANEMTRSVHLEAEVTAAARKAQTFDKVAAGHRLEAERLKQKIKWQEEECGLIEQRKELVARLKRAARNHQAARLSMGALLPQVDEDVSDMSEARLRPPADACRNHGKESVANESLCIAQEPVLLWRKAVGASVVLERVRQKHYEAILNLADSEKAVTAAHSALQKSLVACSEAENLVSNSRPTSAEASQASPSPSKARVREEAAAVALFGRMHATAVAAHKEAKETLSVSQHEEAAAGVKAQVAEYHYSAALDCAHAAETRAAWWSKCSSTDQDMQTAVKLIDMLSKQEQVL